MKRIILSGFIVCLMLCCPLLAGCQAEQSSQASRENYYLVERDSTSPTPIEDFFFNHLLPQEGEEIVTQTLELSQESALAIANAVIEDYWGTSAVENTYYEVCEVGGRGYFAVLRRYPQKDEGYMIMIDKTTAEILYAGALQASEKEFWEIPD